MQLMPAFAFPVAALVLVCLSPIAAVAQTRSPAEVFDQPVTLPAEPVGSPTDTSRIDTTLGDAAGDPAPEN